MNHRDILRDLFDSALNAVSGRPAVRNELAREPMGEGAVSLIAIGKAADSMVLGAIDALGGQLHSGLVITKWGHLSSACLNDPRLRCVEASHPIPDSSSLEAGELLLEYLANLPATQKLLVLVSGGASSLVEVLPTGYGAEKLMELNQWLLSQHIDIGRINAVRQTVSCIKGGRLALRLGSRRTRLLLVSDVPGDNPASIGSGLLVAVPKIMNAESSSLLEAPDWIRRAAAKAPPMPETKNAAFDGITQRIIASNAQAREAVAKRAAKLGLPVMKHSTPLTGDSLQMGKTIAEAVVEGSAGVQVWGGETTVELPPSPGRGGRAQALALRASMVLEGKPNIWLLAAGTDGTDGPGEDAGAIVDSLSCSRGRRAGLDPDYCLKTADSGTFLNASGDLVRTGPTGTNVMDLVISLKEEEKKYQTMPQFF